MVESNIQPVFSDVLWQSTGMALKIHPYILACLQTHFHIERMTAIQHSCLQPLVDGKDALVKAQTGSGKTLAYAVPLLSQLMKYEPPINRTNGPCALVILPTRELATQTAEVFTALTKACVRIVSAALVGGMKRKSQKASLRKGVNIVIGTPQRILDHLSKTESLRLNRLQWLVIDEADLLLEMGFERDVRQIVDSVHQQQAENTSGDIIKDDPVRRLQTVLLSATLTSGVETLAGLALRNPSNCDTGGNEKREIKCEPGQSASTPCAMAEFSLPAGLKHYLLVVPGKLRLVALAAFILLKCRYNAIGGKLIVFMATQDCVDFHYRLFQETLCGDDEDLIVSEDVHTLSLFRLHGKMDHKERQPVFREFSRSTGGVLLTTDVASRGLDLAGVGWVLQYHVASSDGGALAAGDAGPVGYVHRVGRTARAGGRGKALLLLQPEETDYADYLVTSLGIRLETIALDDVLQAVLMHLRNLKHMAVVSLVGGRSFAYASAQDAASRLSRLFVETTAADASGLKALAERAFVSYLRAYASHPGRLRELLSYRRLHSGHVARAFCLTDPPSVVSARVSGRATAAKTAGRSSGGKWDLATPDNEFAPKKRARRLELDAEEIAQQTVKRARRLKPADQAHRNMMAEFGL